MRLLQLIISIEQEEECIYIAYDKIFDILLDPYHGQQMLRAQLQIRLQKTSKDHRNKFSQTSGRVEK